MIVVCGEALFDVFPQDETPAGIELSARKGGSPFNLAVGLARLGTKPMFFGGLSTDVFGRRLERALEREGVDLTAAPRLDLPSPLVVVSVDAQGVPAYAFYGNNTADRTVGFDGRRRASCRVFTKLKIWLWLPMTTMDKQIFLHYYDNDGQRAIAPQHLHDGSKRATAREPSMRR